MLASSFPPAEGIWTLRLQADPEAKRAGATDADREEAGDVGATAALEEDAERGRGMAASVKRVRRVAAAMGEAQAAAVDADTLARLSGPPTPRKVRTMR